MRYHYNWQEIKQIWFENVFCSRWQRRWQFYIEMSCWLGKDNVIADWTRSVSQLQNQALGENLNEIMKGRFVNLLTCNLVWLIMMTSSVKKRGCPLTTIVQLVKGAKYRKLPYRDRMIRRLLPTYHFYLVVKGAKWRIPESDRWWYRYLTTFAHLSQLTLPIIAEPAIQWITFHAMVHLQFTMHRPFTNHRSFTIHAFSRGAGASSSIEKAPNL